VAYAVYTSLVQDAPGQPFYAVNNLLTFDLSNPAANLNRPIVALPRNEEIVGMDMRPATGQLYVLTRQRDQGQLVSSARLYTIDFAATPSVTSAVATIVNPLTTNLNALTVGFDFNPVTDRIRIVTDQAQNLNVDPNNGSTIVESSLPRQTFATAAAYDNNFAGATTSNLYILNRSFVAPIGTTSRLYLVNQPSAGTLTEIGSLNLTGFNIANFDIGGVSNTAYGIFQDTGGLTYLYNIDLTTGAARRANLFNFSSLNNLGQLNGLAIGLGF
jgi:hypothetical protein